jgi:hypothetical protein
MGGHTFDIGIPFSLITTGVSLPSGKGYFMSTPLPSSWVGRTLYFELAATDSTGTLFDSNIEPVLLH